MIDYEFTTAEELGLGLAEKVRERRLALGWKQSTLAERSGVSLGSLRRFESQGLISLNSLLNIAMSLGHLEDFMSLFEAPPIQSLDDLESAETVARRGRL
mgnify:CR=1 FL=1